MTASPLIIPVARFLTISGGAALAGGFVYTYESGTDTPKATYTDFDAGTENTNPVELDASGQANIWLNGNYRINLTDANDVQQPNYPVDNVSSFNTEGSSEYIVATGTANNYILTPSPAIVSYEEGLTYLVKINATNTGASQVNVSGLGNVDIVKLVDTNLSGGELVEDTIYRIVYDGSNFQIIGTTTYGFKNANITSAATVNLANITGTYAHITGTTTISSFGTVPAGQLRYLTFDDALDLTYNATSMILPGGIDITTTAGDSAIFVSEGAGNWRCISYLTASGGSIGITDIEHGGTNADNAADARTNLGLGTAAIYNVGTAAGNIVQLDGSAKLPAVDGSQLTNIYQAHIVTLTSTTEDSTALQILMDNSIPQNTEGKEYFSQAFTPISASSTLIIDVAIQGVRADTAENIFVGALFVDSTANAIAACGIVTSVSTSAYLSPYSLRFITTSGSTSARTYKFRFGVGTGGGTVYIFDPTTGTLGRIIQNSMTITEYKT